MRTNWKAPMGVNEQIEYEEVVAEAGNDYRPVRFTRVKYKKSPTPHIDIRVFQRGYDDDGGEVYYPTKSGFQLLESEFMRAVKHWMVLPSTYVHPDVMNESFELLAKRQFESAVLRAFKCVEVKIREKAAMASDDVGVRMIRRAFDPNSGKLADMSLPLAEREAAAHYVAGAYGLYRNPSAHRSVKMDFVEAFERIVIASNLLKLVESAPVNVSTS